LDNNRRRGAGTLPLNFSTSKKVFIGFALALLSLLTSLLLMYLTLFNLKA